MLKCARCEVELEGEADEALPKEVYCSECTRERQIEDLSDRLEQESEKVEAQRIVLADAYAEVKELRDRLNEAEAEKLNLETGCEALARKAEVAEAALVKDSSDLAMDIDRARAALGTEESREAFERIVKSLLFCAFQIGHTENCATFWDDDDYDPSPCTCGAVHIQRLNPDFKE